MTAAASHTTPQRLAAFAGGIAAILLAGFVLARTLGFLLGGEETRRIVTPALLAPDGQSLAAVVEVSRGGATVGFSYEVVIHRGGGVADASQGGVWIWRAYGLPPKEISWSGPHTLHVLVDRSNKAYFGFIKTRTRHGISAITDIR